MGQLAYDLPDPSPSSSPHRHSPYQPPHNHYSRIASHGSATTSPQIDTALRLFSSFTPRETKLFFDLMLARMSVPAKEALTQVVWTSLSSVEKEWFELPRRVRGDDEGHVAARATTTGQGNAAVDSQWSEEEILCGFAGAVLPARNVVNVASLPSNTGGGSSNPTVRRTVGGMRLEFGSLNRSIGTSTAAGTATTATLVTSRPASNFLLPRLLPGLDSNSVDDGDDDEDEGAANTLIAAGREMSARMAAREIEDSIFGAFIQAVRGADRTLGEQSGGQPNGLDRWRAAWRVD